MVKDIYYINTSVRLELPTGQIVYAHISFHENTNNVDATIKQITDGKVKVLGFGSFRKEKCGKFYPVSGHDELKVMGVKFKKDTIKSVSIFTMDGSTITTICLHYTESNGSMDSCSIGIGHLDDPNKYVDEVFAKLNIKR